MPLLVEVATPRIVISAPKGKTGKTLTTLVLAYALSRRGLRVQTFKVGPDYIDPTYHRVATGRYARNLDVILHGPEKTLERFARYALDADIALIEGVMGLYDSPDGLSELGSTAYIAKLTRSPVILVLDAERVNRTLAAIIRGLKQFDPRVKIRGVILTNTASSRQVEKIRRILERELPDVELLGVLPRSESIAELFRYRHLGLVPVPESEEESKIVDLLDELSSYVDVDSIIRVAREAEPIRVVVKEEQQFSLPEGLELKIGVVYDNVFTFYYPEVIEWCIRCSTQVYFINALRDSELPPDLDILIIGGGFPEEHAEALYKNKPLRTSIRRFSEKGGFIYAECGGLIYLMSTLVTLRNEEYEMCSVFDGVAYMLRRPVGHGYVVAEVVEDNIAMRKGQIIRGHEFHHSKVILRDSDAKICLRLLRGSGLGDRRDGLLKNNTYAQYMHIHPDTYNYISVLVKNYLSVDSPHTR